MKNLSSKLKALNKVYSTEVVVDRLEVLEQMNRDLLAELVNIKMKIRGCRVDAYEPDLQDTRTVVVLEDFSTHTEYDEGSGEDVEYNGWYEDLTRIIFKLRSELN